MTQAQAKQAIEKLGLTAEIDRDWIRITGDSYPVKDELKAIGCFFGGKQKKWFWKPETEPKPKSDKTASTASKPAKAKKKRKPANRRKAGEQKFEVTWGINHSKGTARMGKAVVYAESISKAKPKATKTVKAWCDLPHKTWDDQRKELKSEFSGTHTRKWRTTTDKHGKPAAVLNFTFCLVSSPYYVIVRTPAPVETEQQAA